jgi:hypothetical protein
MQNFTTLGQPLLEHGTLGLLGLSPSVLGGGTLGNPPHNMWTPQSPLVRGSPLSIKILWEQWYPRAPPLYWRRVQCQHWVQCQGPNPGLEDFETHQKCFPYRGNQTICINGQHYCLCKYFHNVTLFKWNTRWKKTMSKLKPPVLKPSITQTHNRKYSWALDKKKQNHYPILALYKYDINYKIKTYHQSENITSIMISSPNKCWLEFDNIYLIISLQTTPAVPCKHKSVKNKYLACKLSPP